MPLLRKISALVLALFIMITVMTPFSYVKAETITSVELIKNGDFSSRDFWVFTPNACANHSACNNMHIDGAGFLYFQWNQTTRSDYVRQIIQPTVPLGEEDDMVFSYQIKDSYNGRDARAQIKIGEKIITKEELSSNTQFPQKNVFYTRTFQFKAKELCGSLSNCEEYLRNGFQIEIEARRGARGDTDFQIDNMSLRKTHTFYDVIFRDGGQELQNTSVAKGAQITAPVNPSRPGMVFAGWEKVGTSQIFTSFGASDIALADVTFEAEWNYTPMQAQDQTLRLSAGAIPAIETFVANRSELATDAQFEWKEGAPNFDRTSVQSQTRTLVYKHNAVVVNEVPVTINFMDDIQPEISDQTFVLFEGDLPAGGVSVSASDNIGLTNYTAGVSFAGLNLSNAGVVDGTVSTAHARSHEITVADAAGNEKKANLTLDVLSFPKVVLTPKIYGQEQYSQDEIISAIKNVHHAKGLLDSYYTNREIGTIPQGGGGFAQEADAYVTNKYGQRVKVVYEVSYIYKKPIPQVQSLFIDDTLDPKNSFPAGTFDVGNQWGLKAATWRTNLLTTATRNALKKQNPEHLVTSTDVILEYHDGTTETVNVQINRKPHTARNTPTSKPSMIKNVGDPLSPADFVNLTSSDNPQYSWEGDAPTSDTPGPKSGTVRVTYADESFDLVGVSFEVQDRQPPQFTATIPDQYFFANMEINPIVIPVTDNVGVVRLATNKDAQPEYLMRFDGLNWGGKITIADRYSNTRITAWDANNRSATSNPFTIYTVNIQTGSIVKPYGASLTEDEIKNKITFPSKYSVPRSHFTLELLNPTLPTAGLNNLVEVKVTNPNGQVQIVTVKVDFLDEKIKKTDPSQPLPAGYVEVKFDKGANGILEDDGQEVNQVSYFVVKDKELSPFNLPGIKPNLGYTARPWTLPNPLRFSRSVTYTAQYTPIADIVDGDQPKPVGYVTVTFDKAANGEFGAGAKTSYHVNPNKTVTLTEPAIVANVGYTFNNWNEAVANQFSTDKTYTAQYTPIADIVDGDQPKPVGYVTVTFDKATNGEFGPGVKTSYHVNPNKTVTLTEPGITPNVGYLFAGWNETVATQFSADKTYTAQYTPIADVVDGDQPKPAGYVTVTFDKAANGEFGPGAKTSYHVNPNKTVNLNIPAIVANVGYTFNNWNETVANQFSTDKTYIAQYTPIADIVDGDQPKPAGYVTVTFDKATNGEFGAGAKTSFHVNPNKTVTISEPAIVANVGYTFNHWNEAVANQFSADKTYIAQYTPIADIVDGDQPKPAGYVTVTFEKATNGEFRPGAKTSYHVNPNKTVNLNIPVIVANVGYTFNNWNEAVANQFSTDKTYIAQYTPIADVVDGDQQKPAGYVTVTFEKATNGEFGVGAKTSFHVNPNKTVTLTEPVIVANVGYTFNNWNEAVANQFSTDKTYTAQYTPIADIVDGDQPKPAGYVTVTFDKAANGEFGPGAKTSYHVNPNKTVNLNIPVIVANVGYTFNNWNEAVATQFSADKTYTAQYTPIADIVDGDQPKPTGYVTVIFDKAMNGEFGAGAKTSFHVNPNKTVTLTEPGITPNVGYLFGGWNEALTTQFSADKTYTAQYTPIADIVDGDQPKPAGYVTVTFEKATNGEFEPGAKTSFHVNPNKTVTITEPEIVANVGYTFNNWNEAVANQFSADKTYTAQYTPIADVVDGDQPKPAGYVTVTFEKATNGEFGAGAKTSFHVNPNKTVTITEPAIVANVGYTFNNWNETVANQFSTDKTYTAQYTPIADIVDGDQPKPAGYVTVTFEKATNGEFGAGAKTSFHVNPNKTVTITEPAIVANVGYLFAGWNEAVATQFSADKTYTAQYTPIADIVDGDQPKPAGYVTVTFDKAANGEFGAGAKTSYHVNPNKTVTLTEPGITPNLGYLFAGWNEAVATQFSADKTYTAQYTLKKSQISYLFESQDVTPYLSDLDQYKPADYQADYFTTQTPASPSALSHAVSNGKWFWKGWDLVSWNVNEDQKTFIGKWLFDENPNGVIDGNPLNRTNQSITLTLRTNEPVETPAGWTPVGNSETEFTKIVDQNSTISVQVQDKVGNSSANITLTVSKIDKKEPINLTLETEGNVSLIKDAEVKINFSAEDDLSGIKEYQCKTQNGNWEVCSNPFVIRNLVEGVNTISMKAIDNAGNVSETSIQVTSDRTPPVISLQAGDLVLVHNVDPYVFANATCQDNIDATCSVTYGPSDVPTQIQNLANTALSGAVVFEEIYTATDKAGNKSEIKRKITLIPADYPVLSLSGASVVTQELGTPYLDAGASATDVQDGDLTNAILVTNPVRDELGTYTIVYKVTDASNNVVEITRTVHVVDTTPPAIVAIADQVFAENADIGAIDVQVSDLNPQLDVRVDGLPAGLSFDPVSKKITGKSSQIGTHQIKILAKDGSNNQNSLTFSLTIKDIGLPKLQQVDNLRLRVNRDISPIIFTGTDNFAIDRVAIDGLPNGLTFATGSINADRLWELKITGKPTRTGNYPIVVNIRDKDGNQGVPMRFELRVYRPSDAASDPVVTIQDDCPLGDLSGSRTDGRCDPILPDDPQPDPKADPIPDPTQDPTLVYPDDLIYNPNIKDGQCYTRRPYLGIKDSEKITTTEEFKKALSFLWSYEMTMYDSVDGYDPYRNLSREEAAKIFSQFAINVLCRKPDLNLHINYTDTENADPTLKPYITLAYQLGVMKGSGMGDGEFRPFDSITKAEINAVLIRMILKSYMDETVHADKVWYSEYNKVATELGIIRNGAGMESVSRNNTALMLFRAYKNQVFDWMNIDYFSYVLSSRDIFLR